MEIAIYALFESRNGGEPETVRIDGMTPRQFSYVRWHEHRYCRRRLTAIIGEVSGTQICMDEQG
jgi:hypothetical protein